MRERDAMTAELIAALDAHGIAPDRDRTAGPTRHTERRRWRSTVQAPAEPVPHAWLVPADPF